MPWPSSSIVIIVCLSTFFISIRTSEAAWRIPLMTKFNSARSIFSLSTNSRSEEHTSELQSRFDLVCRLLLEKKKQQALANIIHKLELMQLDNEKTND